MAILCTGSRAPLVGTISGVIFIYYYLERTGKAGKKTTLSLLIAFVLTVFLVIFVALFPNFRTGNTFIDYTISRFSSTFNFESEWGNVERLTRWSYYLKVFFENPFSGIGLATTSAEVLSNVKVTAHGITTESGVIARLVETGIVGTSAYYIFFFLCVNQAFKDMKFNMLHGKTAQLFVLGVVVLFIVEDFVLQISLDIFATFILWLMIAFSVNYISFSNREAM